MWTCSDQSAPDYIYISRIWWSWQMQEVKPLQACVHKLKEQMRKQIMLQYRAENKCLCPVLNCKTTPDTSCTYIHLCLHLWGSPIYSFTLPQFSSSSDHLVYSQNELGTSQRINTQQDRALTNLIGKTNTAMATAKELMIFAVYCSILLTVFV